MDLGLKGKRALVTGSSRGLGKAIARLLAVEGADVVVTGRTLEAVAASAREIQEASGRQIIPLTVELTDVESIRQLAQAAAAQLGPIDILVNSGARVSGRLPEDFAHITDDIILHDFEEKYLGSLRMIREVVPAMRERHWGRILTISGSSARYAGGISAGARNAAVVNLTKNLANELGRDGIHVNAIYPATTITETFTDRMAAQAERLGRSVEEHVRRMHAQPAIGRLVTAEELAQVAVFLVSPRAVGITGEVIAVTGGSGNAIHY